VVEQAAVNRLVAGSIPARAANCVIWVYILQNTAGRFYVGHTDNLERRLLQHNEPRPHLGKFTHKLGPWKLVWSEAHPTRSAAMQRERAIKAWKSTAAIRRLIADAQW
jgi:predicted GIY-YIG superfamily endonuclease